MIWNKLFVHYLMGCVAMSSMPCYVSDSNKFDMNALCPWMGNENGRKRERKTSFLSCVWVRQHTCFMAPNPRSVPGKNRPITFDLDDREFDDLCFCAHALNHRVDAGIVHIYRATNAGFSGLVTSKLPFLLCWLHSASVGVCTENQTMWWR